jgi:hypothetical protein
MITDSPIIVLRLTSHRLTCTLTTEYSTLPCVSQITSTEIWGKMFRNNCPWWKPDGRQSSTTAASISGWSSQSRDANDPRQYGFQNLPHGLASFLVRTEVNVACPRLWVFSSRQACSASQPASANQDPDGILVWRSRVHRDGRRREPKKHSGYCSHQRCSP